MVALPASRVLEGEGALMRRFRRRTSAGVSSVTAGCFDCYGNEGHWFSKNAQALAARHTDATGHKTWVDSILTITYEAAGVRTEGGS